LSVESFASASSIGTGFVASVLHDMAVDITNTKFSARITYLSKNWFLKCRDSSFVVSNLCRMIAHLWTEHPEDRMEAVWEMPVHGTDTAVESFLTYDKPSEPEFTREPCVVDRTEVDITYMEDPIHLVIDVCGQPVTCAVLLRQVPGVLCELLLLGPMAIAVRGYTGWYQCVTAYPNVPFGLCVRCDWLAGENGYALRVVRMVLRNRPVWCSFYFGDGSDLTQPVDVLRSYEWPVEFVEAMFGGERQMKRLGTGAHLEIGAQPMAELIYRHISLGGRCFVLDTEKIPMNQGGPYDVTDWHVVSLTGDQQWSGVDADSLLSWWKACSRESFDRQFDSVWASSAVLLLVKGIGRELGVFQKMGVDLTLRSYGSLWSGILDVSSLVAGDWLPEAGKKHLARNGVYQKAMHVMRAVWRTERLTHSVYGLYEDEWLRRVKALPKIVMREPYLLSRYGVRVPFKLASTHRVGYAPLQSWPKYIRSMVSPNRDVIPMDCSVCMREFKPDRETAVQFFSGYASRKAWKMKWVKDLECGVGYCVWLLDKLSEGLPPDMGGGVDVARARGLMFCRVSEVGAYILSVIDREVDCVEDDDREVAGLDQ